MSKRDWGTGFAIGLITALGISLLLLVVAVPGFRNPAYYQEAQIASDQENRAEEPGKANQKPEWRYWAQRLIVLEDTPAQWVMAFFTILATGVSIWAVRLVRDTLDTNRLATEAARDAVTIAEKTLEETIKANRAVTRPYLFFVEVDGDEAKPFAPGVETPFALRNCGQTPAHNVRVQTNWMIVKRPIGDQRVNLGDEQGNYGTIGPGVSVTDTLTANINQGEIDRIFYGEVLLLRMRISYEFPPNCSDSHDVTWMLDSYGLPTGSFHQIGEDERWRED